MAEARASCSHEEATRLAAGGDAPIDHFAGAPREASVGPSVAQGPDA
jgi:hypothetical protein